MTPERSGGRAKFLSRAGVRSGQLDGWTPIALDGVGPTQLVWADLHDRAFNAPFFTHIIDAWRRDGAKDAVRTDLSALPTQDPALDPDLIIAHPSRTGSTLLARLAAAEAGSILVSEPGILSGLLERHLAGTLGAPIGPTLQAVVRAQGRRRPAEQRYILKLNSQGARFLPEIRRAFPKTPILWLQRQPARIVESNLSRPARGHPQQSEALADWVLRRVTLAFLAATAFVDGDVPVLDYDDLLRPDSHGLAMLLGIDPTPATLARMREIAGRDSRTGARFVPRDRMPVPIAVEAIVRKTLDPMYAAIRAGRAA